MPTFKVEVTEYRSVRATYWVEVDDVEDIEEVKDKALSGETVHEEYGKHYDVMERDVLEEPTLDAVR